MKKSLIFLLILLVSSLTNMMCPQANSQTLDEKLYRIYIEDFTRIKNLEKSGVTIYNMNPESYVEIIATSNQAEKLKHEGFSIEYLAKDFKELIGFDRLKAAPEYHDYQETIDELNDIATRFPDISHLTKIGESVLERDILCLKISDNPEQDEDEVPILICGAHHGNEVLSVEAILYQINYLVDNYGTDTEVTNWIDNYEIWFVPLVNPDGREAVRRYNENDIDLNRNYSFAHTAGGTHGDAGFSEPETSAIRDLAAQFPPALSLTYHTSGRYFLYSWTHTDDGAPDSTAMINLGNILAESVQFPDGNSTGHYTLLQGGRWYFTQGEYCDYMYAIHNTLAFTVEMWTRQNPEASVIPQVIERNLDGFKTLLRQASLSGVTGLITDKVTGQVVEAEISIPAIDDQGKLSPYLADAAYGRYYKYLAPGSYQLKITAEGYRDKLIDIEIDAQSMLSLDIQMESGPLITLGEAQLLDNNLNGFSGNGDGRINLGENLGYLVSFNNANEIDAESAYAKVQVNSHYVDLQTDSLFIGDILGTANMQALDTLLFSVDPSCPDGEELEFVFTVYDLAGPGWKLTLATEMHAPDFVIKQVRIIDDEGDQDGVWDPGEKITADIQIENIGRQTASILVSDVTTANEEFSVLSSQVELAEIAENQVGSLLFDLQMAEGITEILIGAFEISISSFEGYSYSGSFQLTNVDGFYDDFEHGENGWTHDSYRITSNDHDDWMLGLPVGKAGDPDHAFSGQNCWGTDLGFELYEGDTWNGEYQSSVHNYLMSPVIDCSNMKGVGLQYMQWLTALSNDIAYVKVNDSLIWDSSRRGHSDQEWIKQNFDISGIADGNSAVQIIFEMKTNNYSNAGGWNIDDVIVANGIYGSSSIEDPHKVYELSLSAYPNPMRDESSLGFTLPSSQNIQVDILDLKGRLIKRLIDSEHSEGSHVITWDGSDHSGARLPSGIYLARLKTSTQAIYQQLIIIN